MPSNVVVRRVSVAVIWFVAAGAIQPLNPQTDSFPTQITVAGQAVVRLAPTRAILYLLIEATAPTPGEAAARGAQFTEAVRDTLQRIGGAGELSVVQYGVLPTSPQQYGGVAVGPSNVFTGRTAIRFVASITQLPALTAAAFAKGASGIAAPSFLSDDLPGAVARAVEQATANARQQAEAIARGLGFRLGPPSSIHSPQAFESHYPIPQHFAPGPGYDAQSRPLPEIRATITVTGTWSLLPGR